jgi:hypothetical protein
MELRDFANEISVVGHEIVDQLSEHRPTKPLQVPKDWRELLSIVRSAAENLILCVDVKEAIARLRRDPKALQAVLFLTSHVTEGDTMLAIRRAHAGTVHTPSALPFHAYCSYLIELCKLLEHESPSV